MISPPVFADYYGDSQQECISTPATVTRCQKRISGPLLDRIDFHVEAPRVAYDKLTDQQLGEASEMVRAHVVAAQARQRLRFAATGLARNADMTPADVAKYCKFDETSTSLMRTAMSQLQLSARGFHRVLKLARTIADLPDSASTQPAHLAKALNLRPAEAAAMRLKGQS